MLPKHTKATEIWESRVMMGWLLSSDDPYTAILTPHGLSVVEQKLKICRGKSIHGRIILVDGSVNHVSLLFL